MTDQPHDNEARARYRHVKRGTEYEVIGLASLQNATDQLLFDHHEMVIYRGDDGQLWAREEGEFHDGRFALSTPAPAVQNGREAIADLLARLDDWAPGLTAVRKDCLEAASTIRDLLAVARSDSAGGVASEPMNLIRKGGAYYRPNAQGYTRNQSEAGHYTLSEAISHSHPNGPDGPRDGIDYIPAPTASGGGERACQKCGFLPEKTG